MLFLMLRDLAGDDNACGKESAQKKEYANTDYDSHIIRQLRMFSNNSSNFCFMIFRPLLFFPRAA